jgi:hypothetical protein
VWEFDPKRSRNSGARKEKTHRAIVKLATRKASRRERVPRVVSAHLSALR